MLGLVSKWSTKRIGSAIEHKSAENAERHSQTTGQRYLAARDDIYAVRFNFCFSTRSRFEHWCAFSAMASTSRLGL